MTDNQENLVFFQISYLFFLDFADGNGHLIWILATGF